MLHVCCMQVTLTGSRYKLSGLRLPEFRPWMEAVLGLSLDETVQSVPQLEADKVPKPILNNDFVDAVHNIGMELSSDTMDR